MTFSLGKDKHTHIDVYGYYPFANPESIEDYRFEVQKDRARLPRTAKMGGYEGAIFSETGVSDVLPPAVIRLPWRIGHV